MRWYEIKTALPNKKKAFQLADENNINPARALSVALLQTNQKYEVTFDKPNSSYIK
jgi:hypothetical protein